LRPAAAHENVVCMTVVTDLDLPEIDLTSGTLSG